MNMIYSFRKNLPYKVRLVSLFYFLIADEARSTNSVEIGAISDIISTHTTFSRLAFAMQNLGFIGHLSFLFGPNCGLVTMHIADLDGDARKKFQPVFQFFFRISFVLTACPVFAHMFLDIRLSLHNS
jgi:hypothetical protein